MHTALVVPCCHGCKPTSNNFVKHQILLERTESASPLRCDAEKKKSLLCISFDEWGKHDIGRTWRISQSVIYRDLMIV